MFKLIGVLFVILGGISYGLLERLRLGLRVRQLKQAEGLLQEMESEISYGKESLAHACRAVSERISEPYASFLQGVYETSRQNTGKPFDQLWREQLYETAPKLFLTSEETELMAEFGSCSGYLDITMQKSGIKRLQSEFQKRVKQAEGDCGAKGRVVLCLSAAGSMVLVMLLI